MEDNDYEVGSKVKVITDNNTFSGTVTAIEICYLQVDNIKLHWNRIKSIKILNNEE